MFAEYDCTAVSCLQWMGCSAIGQNGVNALWPAVAAANGETEHALAPSMAEVTAWACAMKRRNATPISAQVGWGAALQLKKQRYFYKRQPF